MPDYITVAKIVDLKPGQAKIILAGGQQIALFNVGGNFYATSNVCLHMAGPLGEGDLSDQVVSCPYHGWQYDVKTGVSETNPSVKVKTYEVKTEGSSILISL